MTSNLKPDILRIRTSKAKTLASEPSSTPFTKTHSITLNNCRRISRVNGT